ncbi:hypothetical protein EYC84_000650 [Monilinia fructicola]|uniref:Uncharacterized protein n=1 Tax=Monilinia fructicola TaxID=38448 RepID=A0A5M9JRS5_MONFR|nr:hypothetical protein EYC84_000650 [Monilinia fructicola]
MLWFIYIYIKAFQSPYPPLLILRVFSCIPYSIWGDPTLPLNKVLINTTRYNTTLRYTTLYYTTFTYKIYNTLIRG